MFYDRQNGCTKVFYNEVPVYQHTRRSILEDLNLPFQIISFAVEKNYWTTLGILLQRISFFYYRIKNKVLCSV